MAGTHEHILTELALQRSLLKAVNPALREKAAAQLYRFTSVLFGSPLCEAALKSEASQWKRSLADQQAAALDHAVKQPIFELANKMQREVWDGAGTQEPTKWLVKEVPAEASTWGKNLFQSLSTWNLRLAGTLAVPFFSPKDVNALIFLFTDLHGNISLLPEDNCYEKHREVIPQIENISSTLRSFSRQFAIATGVADSLETLSSSDLLRSFHDAIVAITSGAPLGIPWNSQHALTKFEDNGHRAKLIAGALYLIDTISLRLRGDAIAEHVLARLVVYLERFAKDEILSKIRERKRVAESTIQFAVDSFIFSEGLYPITHVEAANGKIDTFIESARSLFDEAEKPGNAAILIELKQAMEGATKASLERIARDAISQAEQYRAHLNAFQNWKGHRVIVMIAYGGDARYFSKLDNLYLVYLGDKTPSQAKTIVLDL